MSSCITEPAGIECQCVSGFMSLVQANAPVQMAPLQCAGSSPATMVADLQLGTKLPPGPAEVVFDVTFENASAHLAVPVTIAGG